ncbi:MAG: DUF924 family protein [Pseudomonadota bacterium]
MPVTPQAVVSFWLNDCSPQDWYVRSDALDETIRRRFGLAWRMARAGAFAGWEASPPSALALLILLDQFPRNMFRDDGRAFATDARARRVAARALARGFDRHADAPARMFFFMPFEHSEALADQNRAVRLFADRMSDAKFLLHARAHRAVVARFGRFPHRNAALRRASTAEEADWLAAGGYAQEVERLSA